MEFTQWFELLEEKISITEKQAFASQMFLGFYRSDHGFILLKGRVIKDDLGPPQTREIVVDNDLVVDHKKLSITKKPVCEASYR